MEISPPLPAELLRLIVCPQCRSSLEFVQDGAAAVSLRCTGCGHFYPIVDGIPILIIGSLNAETSGAK